MATSEDSRKPLPPYISFKTFTGFVQKLKETTVPEQIDGSVLKNYAGSTAAQLTAALKFLRLIDENGTASQLLMDVVESYDTVKWQENVHKVANAFQPIVKDLKLESATPKMLNERFRDWGADGEVLEKCVRFYEAVATEAGVKLSPHILNKPRAKPERKPKPKRSKFEENTGDDNDDDFSPPAAGTKRFSFPIPEKPNATLMLPTDLTTEDWEMIDVMIRAYVKRREGK